MRPAREGDGDAVDGVGDRQDGRDGRGRPGRAGARVGAVPRPAFGRRGRRQAGRLAATRRRWPATGNGRDRRRGIAVPGEARHAQPPFRARARRHRRRAARDRGFAGALRRSVSRSASHRVIASSLAWPSRLSMARRSAAAGLVAASARSSASASSDMRVSVAGVMFPQCGVAVPAAAINRPTNDRLPALHRRAPPTPPAAPSAGPPYCSRP